MSTEGQEIEKTSGAHLDASPLFIYYNAKKTHTRDTGVSLWACIDALKRKGAAPEKSWSFSKARVLQKPTDEAYALAARHKLLRSRTVPVDLNSMKRVLADGHAIITGLRLFKKFYAAGRGGSVPWTDNAGLRNPGGAHAMLIVGYNDKRNAFIYRNSWGWSGDRGYYYIDYKYACNRAYNKLGQYYLQNMAGFEFVPRPEPVEVDDLFSDGLELNILQIEPKYFFFNMRDVPNLAANEKGEIRGLKNTRTGTAVDVRVFGMKKDGQNLGIP